MKAKSAAGDRGASGGEDGRMRVLHLEDDPHDAELIRETLASGGLECEVAQAATRDAFLALLDRGDVDLVLSDFSLPGFGGLLALEEVRQRSPDLPFVFVSGTIGEEVAIRSLQAGATDYVLKERLSRLVPAVRRALSEARERSQLRVTESELDRERQFLKAVLDNVEAGIVACDENGRLTLFNRATREMLGIPGPALPPGGWDERHRLLQPDGVTPLQPDALPLARALRGERVRNTEMTIAAEGRAPVTVVASGQPILDARGQRCGAVVAMHDITERKRLEDQLGHSQKMEAIGRLAGGVAHDFNNLLTVILGYGELLREKLANDEAARPDVEEIIRAAERASQVTRQLMTFSRPQVAEPRDFDLNVVVGETERMVRRLIGSDIELICRPCETLGFVRADPGHMQQVLLNLVVNARDAMPRGGRLVIETSDVELDEAFLRGHAGVQPGPFVLLRVSDTGIGMDESTQARIFEPFFTTKGPGEGTGLGLSIVYGIVHRGGGLVQVESRLGSGTTFRIFMPRVAAPRDAGVAPDAPDAPAHPPVAPTVLIVGEDEPLRGVMREALGCDGYAVLVAGDGVEVLDLIERGRLPVDLIVASEPLPGLSAPELARQLAARAARTKVLVTSHRATEALAAVPVLKKPFTSHALLARVREILGPRQCAAA